MLRYLRSICTGLTSHSSWLLGLVGAVSSWKFSNVDMISWTFRFSSLISCHSWDPTPTSQNAQQIVSVTVHHVAMLNLPAATSAADRRLGRRHTSWFVPAAPGRGRWPSCSSPAGRILGPASRSRWPLVNSWCCCCWKHRQQLSGQTANDLGGGELLLSEDVFQSQEASKLVGLKKKIQPDQMQFEHKGTQRKSH